jgi:hypothetical protein
MVEYIMLIFERSMFHPCYLVNNATNKNLSLEIYMGNILGDSQGEYFIIEPYV